MRLVAQIVLHFVSDRKSVNLALRLLFKTILHWIHGYVRKQSTQKAMWTVFLHNH